MGFKEKDIVFDDVFEYIGGEGVFQMTYFMIISVIGVCSVEVIYSKFFGASMDHWCKIPDLLKWPYDVQKMVAIPSTDVSNRGAEGAYSSCEVFNFNYSALTKQDILSWNRSARVTDATEIFPLCPDGWVFDKSEFRTTIISEWNLVCNDSVKVSLVNTIYIAGMFFAGISSGIISDKVGRKPTIMIYILIKVIGGILSAFAPNYAIMMVARFLTGLGSNGVFLTTFVLLMEVSSPKSRTLVGMGHMISFSIGYMIAPGIAFFVRDFRILLCIQTIPTIIGWSLWVAGPESPRWLIVKGRFEEARKVIKFIADVNKKEIPEWLDISSLRTDITNDEAIERPKRTILDLFRTPLIRKWTLVVYLHWFVDSLVYYVFSFNAGNITSSVFINTFLMGAVEIPANILCVLGLRWRTLGRRWTASLALILSGLASFIMIPLVTTGAIPALTLALALVAKAGGKMGFSAIYVYSGEIFPTEVRNVGIGSSSMVSRISGMAAPFIGKELGKIWKGMPFIICGIFGIISGFLTLVLPETLNKPLPQTIEEAEALASPKASTEPDNLSAGLSELKGEVRQRPIVKNEGKDNPAFEYKTRL